LCIDSKSLDKSGIVYASEERVETVHSAEVVGTEPVVGLDAGRT